MVLRRLTGRRQREPRLFTAVAARRRRGRVCYKGASPDPRCRWLISRSSWCRRPSALVRPVLLRAGEPRRPRPRESRPARHGGKTGPECPRAPAGDAENIARVSTLYTRSPADHRHERVLARRTGAVKKPGCAGRVSEIVVRRCARRGGHERLSPARWGGARGTRHGRLPRQLHALVPGIPEVECLGLTACELRVRRRAGRRRAFPALTCLPARVAHSAGDHPQTLYLGEWRTVSGIKLAHAIRRAIGDSTSARLTLLEARFDAPLPAGVFARPAPVVP